MAGAVEQLTPAEARARLEAGALIVDVREPGEWRQARVPDSRHVPLAMLPEQWEDLPRDRPLVLLCAAGARSQVAAQYLAQRGFTVANLRGGIHGWHLAGLPLEA